MQNTALRAASSGTTSLTGCNGVNSKNYAQHFLQISAQMWHLSTVFVLKQPNLHDNPT